MTRLIALNEVKDLVDVYGSFTAIENINNCINSFSGIHIKRLTAKTKAELVELKYDVGLSAKLEEAFKVLKIEEV